MKTTEITNAVVTSTRPMSDEERREMRRLVETGAVSHLYAEKVRGSLSGGVVLKPDGSIDAAVFRDVKARILGIKLR